jgi:hypothetical protein
MIPSEGPKKKSDDYSSEEAIARAKRVLDDRQDFIYHSPQLEAQLVELGFLEPGERLAALEQALDEISAKCRKGPQPPDDFSKGTYAGNRLYAFLWDSVECGVVYLKFSFTGADKMAQLVLHSFHKHVPKNS